MEQVVSGANALSEQSSFLELVHQYQQRPDDSILRSQITLLLGQSAWPCQNISGMYLITDSASEILTSIPENKSLPVARGQGLLLLKFYQEQNQGQATWSMRPGVGLNGNEIIYWRPLYTAGGEPLGILAFYVTKKTPLEPLPLIPALFSIAPALKKSSVKAYPVHRFSLKLINCRKTVAAISQKTATGWLLITTLWRTAGNTCMQFQPIIYTGKPMAGTFCGYRYCQDS